MSLWKTMRTWLFLSLDMSKHICKICFKFWRENHSSKISYNSSYYEWAQNCVVNGCESVGFLLWFRIKHSTMWLWIDVGKGRKVTAWNLPNELQTSKVWSYPFLQIMLKKLFALIFLSLTSGFMQLSFSK